MGTQQQYEIREARIKQEWLNYIMKTHEREKYFHNKKINTKGNNDDKKEFRKTV